MAIETKRQSIEAESLVSDRKVQLTLQADAMVSGAGRDAAETLMEDAVANITGITVMDGRMAVEGTVICQAAYRQRDSDIIRAVEARTALQHVFEDEAIRAGMNGMADAAVTHVEAGFLNGRIMFRITVEVTGSVAGIAATDVIAQIDGCEGIECRWEEFESLRCGAEAVAQASLSESLALPGELETQSTLMDFANVSVEKAERDLGGVRVSGFVNVQVMLAGGIPGKPIAMVKYQMPFQQLVEMPEWLTERVQASGEVNSIRSTLVSGGTSGELELRLDCGITIRVRAVQTQHIKCIADAYAIGGVDLSAEAQTIRYTSEMQNDRYAENYRGTLLLPDGMPPIGNVLAAHARASVTALADDNAAGVAEGILETTVIYIPSGGERPVSVRDELPFRVRLPRKPCEGDKTAVAVMSCEAASLMNDRMEVRCVLQFSINGRTERAVSVANVVLEQEAEPKRAGIVMVWPGRADTPWSIGRRYRIPVSRVETEAGGTALTCGKALVLRV